MFSFIPDGVHRTSLQQFMKKRTGQGVNTLSIYGRMSNTNVAFNCSFNKPEFETDLTKIDQILPKKNSKKYPAHSIQTRNIVSRHM
jgi:hypothetical protein